MPIRRRSAIAFQAGYYIVTGALPLASRRALEALTGPKTDWWLVQMVGLLALTNGLALAAGVRSGKPSKETLALSLLSACSFAAIDTVYALKRRISPIYLADALLEAAIVAAVEWPDHGNDGNDAAEPDGRRWLL
jgi:hypothetical protein